ncbi:hypothetical protein, partial [Nocardia abscessus]|uniref:hypothetical protein n=1 Tax=Nocardia abscessus TaxID=120957 RepID=UPI00245839E6
AAQLLAPRAQLDHDPAYQRSAVLHGSQLAQVHLMLGDLDATVARAPTRILRTAAQAFLDTIALQTPAVPSAKPKSIPTTRNEAPAPGKCRAPTSRW